MADVKVDNTSRCDIFLPYTVNKVYRGLLDQFPLDNIIQPVLNE